MGLGLDGDRRGGSGKSIALGDVRIKSPGFWNQTPFGISRPPARSVAGPVSSDSVSGPEYQTSLSLHLESHLSALSALSPLPEHMSAHMRARTHTHRL